MTAAGRQGFVRLHDAWMTDPKLARLCEAQRFDAVCLFFALIAHSHAHATDGQLLREDVRSVCRTIALPAGNRALDALKRAGLVQSRGSSGAELVAYRRWQTTSDQRESHAERMRTSRARAEPRESLDRERDRERARAAHVPPQPDDDGPGRPVRLGPDSRRVLAELEERKRKGT